MTSRFTNRRRPRLLGRAVHAEVDDELRLHVDLLVERFVAQGLAPEEAERAARARFGDVESLRQELELHDRHRKLTRHRRERVRDFVNDVRFALRGFRRSPGFAVAAILTLALGIGANSAMFSVVDALLLRSLPYQRPGELVSVWGNAPAEFESVRDLSTSFTQVAAYGVKQFSLNDDAAAPARLTGATASWNLFPTLGVGPTLGRSFSPDENEPGRSRVVILSHGFWQGRYGADPAVVGRSIDIDGAPHTVIGVMPPEFRYPNAATQIWTPMLIDRATLGSYWIGDNRVIARLKPGVSPALAQADVRSLGARIRVLNPLWDPGPTYGQAAEVVPLQRALVAAVRPMLLVLLGSVGVVLLIACANVALLLLARANARAREFSIRTALGGGGGRLVQQLMTEALVLATIGATAGLALGWAGVRGLTTFLPPDVPRASAIGIDWRVVAFTSVLAIVTGILFGLVPAARASRASVRSALGEGGSRSSSGVASQRVSNILVSGQVALAVVLVIGAQLLVKSLVELMRIDPGFRAEQVVSARLSPPERSYESAGRKRAFYTQVLERVRARRGVEKAAAIQSLPLAGTNYGMAMRVEGKFEDLRHTLPTAQHLQVATPGYLEVMRIPLLRGRDFTDGDREGTPDVALVSASLAKELWPGEDAVGKRIGAPYPGPWWTVAGVVGDVRQDSLGGEAETMLYRPLLQAPSTTMTIVARVTGDPLALEQGLRASVAELDATVPVSEVRLVAEVVAASVARQRFTMFLVASFAALAVVLGALGIYGLMSYLVSQREREIGVRMALGASPREVQFGVLRRGAVLAAAGAAVGVGGALGTTRLLGGLLYGVSTTDLFTFVNVPLLFVTVALVASWFPARRAMRADPSIVLRGD